MLIFTHLFVDLQQLYLESVQWKPREQSAKEKHQKSSLERSLKIRRQAITYTTCLFLFHYVVLIIEKNHSAGNIKEIKCEKKAGELLLLLVIRVKFDDCSNFCSLQISNWQYQGMWMLVNPHCLESSPRGDWTMGGGVPD